MSKIIVPDKHQNQLEQGLYQPMKRTAFLKYAGATFATSALLLAGCDKKDDTPTTMDVMLTNDDFGILNYAYALEQLEAAFYTQVVKSFYTGATDAEKAILTDLMAHEVIHREFFKAALGAKAIPALEVNFASIDFTNRMSVLSTAKALEDTGVKAYNGAGKLIKNVDYLLVAGKIVSVEARHASAIRDLLNPNSMDFAGDDVVKDPSGLDGAELPSKILPIAATFLKTKITSQLP